MLRITIDEPKPFELHSPADFAAALQLAADHRGDCAYLAGGCDLLDQLKHQWHNPRHVINLKAIKGLSGIERQGGHARVGALTKLSAIERDAELAKVLPALVHGAGRVATPQIRNMGTIGGNLLQDSRCPYYRGPWYCYRDGGIVCDAQHGINREHAIFGGDRCFTVTPSDLAPVVVALDAVIHIRGPGGERRLAAPDLFVPPSENITIMHRLQGGEILTAVEFPVSVGRRSTFIKNTVRNSWDFSRASVAVALSLDGGKARNVRIVLGGVAVVPWRSYAAEQVIEGAALDDKSIEAAASAATDGASPLTYNGYKVGLVRKLVREALTQFAA
jgi:xanthine dehydrogenase YagS FAD-binding subunit